MLRSGKNKSFIKFPEIEDKIKSERLAAVVFCDVLCEVGPPCLVSSPRRVPFDANSNKQYCYTVHPID